MMRDRTIVIRTEFLFNLTCGSIWVVDMLATIYSARRGWWSGTILLGVIMLFLGDRVVTAGGSESASNDPAGEAAQRFEKARQRYATRPTDPVAAWELGRAAFDWAEWVKTEDERETIAKEGIQACRQALARKGDLAPAYYYLALNLGQLARTRMLGALPLVDQMEQALKRAARLEPQFDFAGAHRGLGLLYLEAPGWPVSIGNRRRAREQLETAVKLSPEYPENHLCLLEALLKWNDKQGLERQLPIFQKAWNQAKTNLAGSEWKDEWEDWERRREKLEQSAVVRSLK